MTATRRSRTMLGAIGATAVVATLGLTACSGGSDDAGGVPQVTLQTWGDTQYAELQAETYNDTYPDSPIELKVSAAGQNSAEAIDALRLALSSGKGIPDIVQMNYDAIPEFAEAGVLADVQPYVSDYLDGVTKAGTELMQYQDQYLAFPYEVKTKMWFYRSDLFEQAGIDVDAVETQADFLAAGEKLQAVAPDSYIWNLGPKPEQYTWGMITSGNGAQYSTRTPTCEIVVGSDPGTAEAFRTIRELRESGVVEPNIDDFTPEWQTALADGTIASTLMASWFPTFLEEYAPDLAGKWGVRTWPVIGGAEGGSQGAGSVFVIMDASKNKDAAADFLAKTLLDPKGTGAYAEARGGAWLPAVTDVLDSDTMTNNAYFGPQLVEAFDASSEEFSIFPYDPAATKETTALADQMVNYLASPDADPSRYLDAAQAELQSQVGCPWGN